MTTTFKITDWLYGSYKFTNPLVEELINSQTLQRLKKIAQLGIPDEYYSQKYLTRFEHSVGVMLLLHRLNAPEDEQIAGLLHDISHTAFSHVADYLMGSIQNEDFQDSQHKKFFVDSDVADILRKTNLDPLHFADYHNFGLLERSMPDLCADRIDYALREFPKSVAKKCLVEMTTRDNKIVFKNKDSAFLFGMHFLKREKLNWGSLEAVGKYTLFAKMLSYAIEKKYITFDDLWKYDEFVLSKLKKTNDYEINKTFEVLKVMDLTTLPKSKIVVKKKFRYVDPEIIINNKLVRLSSIDKKYQSELDALRTEREKGVTLPIFGVLGI